MSLCVQRIQKREHLKSLFRPPNQENCDVTTPSDSQLTGRHHQTNSRRSQSVFSSCVGLRTSKAALHSRPVLSLQPHTCRAPGLNCNVSSTKRLLYLHQCSSGARPICTGQKPAAASLSCRTAAETAALGCNSLGLWPKGRSNLEVCAVGIQFP